MRIRLYFDEDAMDSDLVRALRVRGVTPIVTPETLSRKPNTVKY
jgi:hypothetical protein